MNCSSGSVNFALTKDVQPLFLNNQVAMMPGSSAMVFLLNQHPEVKWGMVYAPGKFGRSGGWSFTIPKSAKKRHGAVICALVCQTGKHGPVESGVPFTKIGYERGSLEHPGDAVSALRSAVSKSLPPVPAWTEMQTLIVNELQKVLTGAKTPQQGADDMAKQMNVLLKK